MLLRFKRISYADMTSFSRMPDMAIALLDSVESLGLLVVATTVFSWSVFDIVWLSGAIRVFMSIQRVKKEQA